MTRLPLMLVVTFMTVVFSFHIGTAFAMHDSNLDVNTWLASDNSTQLHTIDLNNGSASTTAATGASTPEETTDETTEGEGEGEDLPLPLADENGDDQNEDEEEEDNGGEDDTGGGDNGEGDE